MWTKVAVAVVCVIVAFYFLLRPTFVNGTTNAAGEAIQAHFGFCYHPLGQPMNFRSTLVRIPRDVEPIRGANGRATDYGSCKARYGILFGLILPLRETMVVEVR